MGTLNSAAVNIAKGVQNTPSPTIKHSGEHQNVIFFLPLLYIFLKTQMGLSLEVLLNRLHTNIHGYID